jgi:hypothetical protein
MTHPSDHGQPQRPPAPGPPGGPYVPPARPQQQPGYGPGPRPSDTGPQPWQQAQRDWRLGDSAAPVEKGVIGALFDVNFNHLVTPKLIKVCYVLALMLVSLSALIVVVIGLWIFQLRNGWLLGLLVMLSAPVVWTFEAILVRIFMEAVVVRFKGVEHLRAIKDKI